MDFLKKFLIASIPMCIGIVTLVLLKYDFVSTLGAPNSTSSTPSSGAFLFGAAFHLFSCCVLVISGIGLACRSRRPLSVICLLLRFVVFGEAFILFSRLTPWPELIVNWGLS